MGSTDKRLIRFVATMGDRPGGIANLTGVISKAGASIKDMIHERAWLYSSVDEVNVKCIVETTGQNTVKNYAKRYLMQDIKSYIGRFHLQIRWHCKIRTDNTDISTLKKIKETRHHKDTVTPTVPLTI